MDPVLRRTSFRLPGIAALLALTILSVLFITSPISAEASLSQVHRRSIELPLLALRQEDPPTPTTTTTDDSSTSATSTSTTSSTPTTTSTTTTSRTSTSSSTSSTSTRTVTSTRPTSTATTTQTITSTTSGSSTGTGTSATSSANLPPTSQVTTGSQTVTDPISGTTLVVPPNFVPGPISSSTTASGGVRASGGIAPTSTSKAESTSASRKSFWDNKGAVAGVFVLISVVVLALLAFFWRALARRRAATRQKRLTAQLFGGKYAESDFTPSNNGHSNFRASAYGDVESNGGVDNSRFQGIPVTIGASASDNPYESQTQYGASALNPWSPPPVAPASRTLPETGVSTGYQPPHSAASTYETAQSHYYTPAGSEQSHSHHASNVPAVTVTAPQQQYMLPSQTLASASSGSSYSNDPFASTPPTAFKGQGGAGDRASYDSFYGGKAL